MNKAFAVLAALAFVLPFMSVSCNGQKITDISGINLVNYAINPDSEKSLLGSRQSPFGGGEQDMFRGPRSSDGSPMLVLLAFVGALVAGIAAFLPSKAGALVCGIGSLANVVLLLMFHSNIENAMGPARLLMAKILDIEFSTGFYLSILMSVGAAIMSFRAVSQNQSPAKVATSSPASG